MTVETDAHPFALTSAEEFGRSLATHLGTSDAASAWLERFAQEEAVCAFPELDKLSYSSYLEALEFCDNGINALMQNSFDVSNDTIDTPSALPAVKAQQDSWEACLTQGKISPEGYHQQIKVLCFWHPSLSQEIRTCAVSSDATAPYKRLRQDLWIDYLDGMDLRNFGGGLDVLKEMPNISPARAYSNGYRFAKRSNALQSEGYANFASEIRSRQDAINQKTEELRSLLNYSLMPDSLHNRKRSDSRKQDIQENPLAYIKLFESKLRHGRPSPENLYGYAYCSTVGYLQGALSLSQLDQNLEKAASLKNNKQPKIYLGVLDAIHSLSAGKHFPDLLCKHELKFHEALFDYHPSQNNAKSVAESLFNTYHRGMISQADYLLAVESTVGEGREFARPVYQHSATLLRHVDDAPLARRFNLLDAREHLRQTANAPKADFNDRAKRTIKAYVTNIAHAQALGELDEWEARSFLKEAFGSDKRRARYALGEISKVSLPCVPEDAAEKVRTLYTSDLHNLNASQRLSGFLNHFYGPSTLDEHLNALIVDINCTCESVSVE